MKYRIRSIIYSLLAGLIVSTSSCRPEEPRLELLSYLELKRFPSASALEYAQGRFYIFGDDAPFLLQTDTAFTIQDSVYYSTDTAYRIKKKIKPDIESVSLYNNGHTNGLLALGSFTNEKRAQVFFFPFSDLHTYQKWDPAWIQHAIRGLEDANLEGLAITSDHLVLANRANTKQRINHLVVTDRYEKRERSAPHLIELALSTKAVLGISGLTYVTDKDLLLFTASEENTSSAIEDGVIGNSYLGWIRNFSKKLQQKSIRPDGMYDLTLSDKVFLKQKVESVCVQGENREGMLLLLASDNDQGESGLFRVRLKL